MDERRHIDERQLMALLERYARDPLFFFEHELKVRKKLGGITPLRLNPAQMMVHNLFETQLKTTGMVRALLLKGRQQGMSTYTEARFFHKNIVQCGVTTNIIAHDSTSSSKIFAMAKLFFDELSAFCKPTLGASNWQTLEFAAKKNIYQVITAGSKDAGRGSTVQYFHGSEVAFWGNAESLISGALQSVAEAPGTEIVLESTGQAGSWFQDIWDQSEAEQTNYAPIFISWTMQPEYVAPAEGELELDEEERELVAAYKLTPEQLAWRRLKMAVLGPELFRQEYPMTPAEAFSAVDGDPYIPSGAVWTAIHNGSGKRLVWTTTGGPTLLGVDIARFGSDKTTLVWRQGRTVLDIKRYAKLDTTAVAGLVREAMRNEQVPVARVFLDASGVGGGVYDTLRNLMLSPLETERLVPIDFGSGAINKHKFDNRRVEMWSAMRDWLLNTAVPVYLPEMRELVSDLSAPRKKFKDSKMLLESKEDMRGRGVKSPDIGDALALTFAYPVLDGNSEWEVQNDGPMYAQERKYAYTISGRDATVRR